MPPGLGIRLVEAPASRRDDPRAKIAIVDHVAPGKTFSRRFEVTNGTTAAMDVRLYVRPARLAGGAFAVDDKQPGEITQWLSVTPPTMRVPAGGAVGAVAEVAVPAGATSGEHYGAILAELPPKGGAQVGVASRVGIRVYLSVGAGGEPASDFAVDSLTPGRTADGKPYVQARVRNTGGRALDMTGTLRLTDGPGGLSAGPFPAKVGTTLAPKQSAPVLVELDKALPDGPWHARLDMASGLLERSVEGTITFPKEGEGSPVRVDEVGSDTPWWTYVVAGIGLLLILLLLWWLLLKLRSRRRKQDEDDEEPALPGGV